MGFADPVNYIVVGFDGDYAMLRNESEPFVVGVGLHLHKGKCLERLPHKASLPGQRIGNRHPECLHPGSGKCMLRV